MNESQYQSLRHLLGAYLHQDWPEEYGTPDAAIAAFKKDEPPECVLGVCKELDEVIPLVERMADPDRFLHEVLWCDYAPQGDGLTVADWLRQVRRQLGCE